MLDGNEIIVLTKDEGRKLLELIRAPYSLVFGGFTRSELEIYQKHDALDLVVKLKELVKEV